MAKTKSAPAKKAVSKAPKAMNPVIAKKGKAAPVAKAGIKRK